jgi:hypothetical protein
MDMDSGYKYRATAALLVILGIASGFLSIQFQISWLSFVSFVLFFIGIFIGFYGLTKINVKGVDLKYQNTLRKTSRLNMVFYILTFIFLILFALAGFYYPKFEILLTLIILTMVFFILGGVVSTYTYFKIAEHVIKSDKQTKIKSIMIFIVIIIIALLLWYVSNLMIF